MTANDSNDNKWMDPALVDNPGLDQGYCPVKTELLLELSPLQADVYIRLSEEKFLKLFRAGDRFEDRDLERYRDQKHIENLWLKADEVRVVAKRLADELEAKLKNPKLEPDEVAESAKNILPVIQSITERLGVTQEVKTLTQLQVSATLKSLQFNWRLTGLLKELKQQGGYLTAHSLALSYVASLIANKTEWSGEYNAAKLCYAAYLHDLTLKNQEVELFDTMADAENSGKFSAQVLKEYQFHPVWAAERCKHFEVIPHDVDPIVRQHHERPDGSGFPRKLKYPQIQPLSAIFILAHELVDFARKRAGNFEMSEFVEAMEPYHLGVFEKIIEAIRFD